MALVWPGDVGRRIQQSTRPVPSGVRASLTSAVSPFTQLRAYPEGSAESPAARVAVAKVAYTSVSIFPYHAFLLASPRVDSSKMRAWVGSLTHREVRA